MRFFCFWGKYPGPRISRNFTREGAAVAYPSCPGIGSPPRGAHFYTAKRESRPRQSGCPAPRVCLGGGGGATFGRRTAGRFRRRAGQPSGARAAHGGRKRARAGEKAAYAGASGGPGGVRGRRGSGQNRGQPGLHPGARRAKNGRRRGKMGRSGGQKGGYGGRWGQKSPFLPRKKAGNGAVLGRKLAEKAGGACRVIWPCAGNLRAVSAEKLGASKKPFRAHIGRNCLSPLFFVDGAPSLGRIIWWFGRVAIWAGKSDECVTPRGTPHGKRKRRQPHENSDFRHRD